MRDDRRRFEDYSILNFRNNTIEYHPPIKFFQLLHLDQNPKEPIIKVFYKENVTQILKWMSSYYETLKQPVPVSFLPKNQFLVYGQFSMRMENFPVVDFAKKFQFTRLLEKKVENMSAYVSSGTLLEVTNSSFYWMTGSPKKGYLTIGSIDTKFKEVIEDEVIVLPIELQGEIKN